MEDTRGTVKRCVITVEFRPGKGCEEGAEKKVI